MKKIVLITSILTATSAFANDSTGYVGTGGIEYLKNKNIAMQREDLFISKKLIKVDYHLKTSVIKILLKLFYSLYHALIILLNPILPILRNY